jgi:hypothetical protein
MIALEVEDKEFLNATLANPGLFLINRVEDYYLLYLGYSVNKEYSILDILDGPFTNYVKEKFELPNNFEIKWYKAIRLFSSTDIHSIQLFKETFSSYCKLNPNSPASPSLSDR